MIGIFVSTLILAAAPADERGTVTRVVVFADRAEVSRRTTAKCEQGSAEAKFFPLTHGIDGRTLRGETAAPAKGSGASSREVALEVELDKRVDEQKAELRKIDARIRELADQDQTADEREKTLRGYETYFHAVLAEAVRDPKPEPKKW